MPSAAVDFLHAGCKWGSLRLIDSFLKVCILHLRVLLYFGLFLTLLQNSTGSTRWGDISMLGALKFALSEFSWWEQGLQAACFDSLPAANGREKLARGGQWGQPGLLPSQNSPSHHAPEISAVHGFAVGEPSHGQGCAEQSRTCLQMQQGSRAGPKDRSASH